MRNFPTGAKRDISGGKHEMHGFRHPLVELSFGRYMHSHREMSDGTLRASSNWWAGWDKEVSLQSMVRHVQDLEALHAGYRVFKERIGNEEITHYVSYPEIPDNWKEINEEETCNAIKFNVNAYLLELLKQKE